jgi:hypothetical protein
MRPNFETFPERLIRLGVPENLQRTKWAEIPGGEKVALWLKLEGPRTYVHGVNWYVVTSEPEHYKVLPMMVRDYSALHKEARFVRLGTLIKLLETKDEKRLKIYEHERLIAIADFFTTSLGPRDRPFTTLQRGRLEEFLLTRNDRRYPTIMQVHNPGHLQINFMPWWTRSAMDRMEMKGLKVNSIIKPIEPPTSTTPPSPNGPQHGQPSSAIQLI